MENELVRDFYCTAAQCNAQQELSLLSLVSDLIETATHHADALGIGNAVMPGRGWVLARLTIEMQKFPSALSNYRIITWVQSWNRHFSERCFEVKDNNGNTIGFSRSVWMVMDLNTHENAGLNHLTLPFGIISDRQCPIARQSRHKPLINAQSSLYTFVYSDIDFYRHVNTLRYIQLLLNQFSLQHFDKYRIARFEIAFMHECYYGETGCVEMLSSNSDVKMAITTNRAAALRAKIKFESR